MKRTIITIIILFIVAAITYSCVKDDKQVTIERPNRISMVEKTIISGHGYFIIKVDNKEYFVNGDGGMIEITKD